MKKITQRLLVFSLGVPFFIVISYFLPYYNHLCLNLLVILFSSLGAVEFSVMLSKKNLNVSKTEAAILGALPPLSMYLYISFHNFPYNTLIIPGIIVSIVSWLFISMIFSRGKGTDDFIKRLAAGLAVLFYPGMLMMWIVRISSSNPIISRIDSPEKSSLLLIVFICIVFLCDSAAWAAGMLFGKNNRGIIPVSPNKSIAGFIGGFAGSAIVGLLAVVFFKDVFNPALNDLFTGAGLLSGALLGLLTGILAALGDLGESAIKRSVNIKDSGVIIPGRGGVLDSIDSLSLAAPGYFLLYSLLF